MKRLIFGFGYFLLAAFVAIVGGYLVMAYVVGSSAEVEVPALTDMTLSEALDLLGRDGLDLDHLARRTHHHIAREHQPLFRQKCVFDTHSPHLKKVGQFMLSGKLAQKLTRRCAPVFTEPRREDAAFVPACSRTA